MTPWLAVILLYAAVIAATVLPVAPFTPLIDIDKNAGPERSFDTYMHLVKRATVDNPLIIYFYKPNCQGPCEDFEHILAALASEKTRSMKRFTFAKAIGDASRSYPDGNPHSSKFLRPLNLHRLPAVRFFPKSEKVECMRDLDAIKNALFKMNMLGKTFPPSLRTNHEPTPYHYAQQMGLSTAKNIAETRALSPRREIASSQHMEMNSFIEAYSTAQAKLEAFTKLFYPVRGGQCHSGTA